MRKFLRRLSILVLSLIVLWLVAASFLIINGLTERVEPADVAFSPGAISEP
jgi:hypothetical protein